MIIVFYFFSLVLVVLSLRSFRGGVKWLAFVRSRLQAAAPDPGPNVTVFVPCRGLDQGMADNIAAILSQDVADYEVIFIVDDEHDPAVGLLKEAARHSPQNVQVSVVVAPKAAAASQKVENLRYAVLQASPAADIFVFADSDIRPSASWLRSLAAPLADRSVGAATGYRWFISLHASLASELRSAWNASIASALGPNTASNFCWGGSMAIRRETFEALNIREAWAGTVSDDLAMTSAINAAALPIVFVPAALTATVEDCTFAELIEFTTRQMKITRVYSPRLWAVSFIGSFVFISVMTAAVCLAAFSDNAFERLAAIVTLSLVSIFSIGKSWLRWSAVRLVLAENKTALDRQFLPQMTLWLVTPLIFLFNCFAAAVSRRIRWRGTVLELKSPTETVIIPQ